jgi:hypothetical protein
VPKNTNTGDVIEDSKKWVEVELPDEGVKIRIGKLKYAQMKEVTRLDDNWERNDLSLVYALKNAGNPKEMDWLDELTTTDVMLLSSTFADMQGGPISLEDWLTEKHPKILEDYQKEVEGATRAARAGSNPLRESSTRTTV